jgi:hypothetical protein
MKKQVLSIMILVIMLSGIPVALSAQQIPERATLLGEMNVRFRAEADVLTLRADGLHRRIILEAVGNSVEIDSVVLVYANGQRDEIPIRQVIGEGTRTRTIDLPGGARNIRRIEFIYTSRGGIRNRRATLRVYGL